MMRFPINGSVMYMSMAVVVGLILSRSFSTTVKTCTLAINQRAAEFGEVDD